jgi:uncharacterized membrane protein
MALISGLGGLGRGESDGSPEARKLSAERWGNRLFIPALVIPATGDLIGTLGLQHVSIGGLPLFQAKQATLISLALGAVLAVITALILLRQPVISPLQEGRRLMDTVGWAGLLPQMLAALGAVFALAGVGKVVGDLVTAWMPMDAPGGGGRLLPGHGPVHDRHGQRLRRLPGDDRRHRPAVPDRQVRRRPGRSSAPSACCRGSAGP